MFLPTRALFEFIGNKTGTLQVDLECLNYGLGSSLSDFFKIKTATANKKKIFDSELSLATASLIQRI
jgi:hypothetical protein